MELAAFLWALADLPVAMSEAGNVVLGPQPWILLPAGPVQLFLGARQPRVAGRVHLLRGPWFAWADLPPPRLALGRALAPAWLAVRGPLGGPSVAWEVLASPRLSLFGSLGGEVGCGIRLRGPHLWAAALIRQGGLTLWCGAYF